jgi:hypothetical protein
MAIASGSPSANLMLRAVPLSPQADKTRRSQKKIPCSRVATGISGGPFQLTNRPVVATVAKKRPLPNELASGRQYKMLSKTT